MRGNTLHSYLCACALAWAYACVSVYFYFVRMLLLLYLLFRNYDLRERIYRWWHEKKAPDNDFSLASKGISLSFLECLDQCICVCVSFFIPFEMLKQCIELN